MDPLPRGIRNNNPGNIRKSADKWKGQLDPDPDFYQFTTAEFGIRAMARILTNYQSLYGLDTIRKLMARWAPPEDGNPTDIYADFVADQVGIDKDQPIEVKDHLPDLIKAIIEFENGQQPYSDKTLATAIYMATGAA